MRNTLLITFFLFISIQTVSAQFRLGTIAGGSVSRFVFEDEEYKDAFRTGYSPGYQLGLMLNYRVSKLYSLHTEMSFLKKGLNVRNRDGFTEVRNQASFYYLSIPALLRFSTHQFIGNQHVEVYLNIGPEVNYWFGGRGVLNTAESKVVLEENHLNYKVKFSDDEQNNGTNMVVAEPFRIQMAVAAGGGIIFDLGREQHFGIDLRGSFGVGKSFHGKQEGGDYGLKLYSENLEGVHHTISITASWFFNFDLNTMMRKGKISMTH